MAWDVADGGRAHAADWQPIDPRIAVQPANHPGVTVSKSDVTFPSGMKIRFVCEAADAVDDVMIDEIAISASRGDEAWQHVCLGRETLDPDMLIRVFASNAATTSVALHEIVLVSPEFLETSVKVP